MTYSNHPKPLAVDLDGTLVRTDTLIEAVVSGLFCQPLATLRALFSLRRGRAAFKQTIAALDTFDLQSVPLREDLVAYLEQEAKNGRELHLVSAAHQLIAERVATRVGFFTTVEGTKNDVNLKGHHKLERLKTRFPGGFSYAGDSAADLPIWREADTIILAGASRATRAAARRLGRPIEKEFLEEPKGIKPWFKTARLDQWTKNALIFVPLVLGHAYTDQEAVLSCILGFLILSLIASATYLFNDMADLSADRQHPRKRNRPLACGDLRLFDAAIAAPTAILVGLVLAALLNGSFFMYLLAYLGVTLSYSFHFKRVPLLDVFLITSLFTLRLIMGIALAAVPQSAWLLAFSMFFFLSLSLSKRYAEIILSEASSAVSIPGREYYVSDGPLILAIGVASGTAAILVLLIYLVNEAFPLAVYGSPQWLWAMPPIVMLWVLRIWLLSHRGQIGDDPVTFAVRDPVSLALASIVVVVFILALQ